MTATWQIFVTLGLLLYGCGFDSSSAKKLESLLAGSSSQSKEASLGGGKIDRVFELHSFDEEISWVDAAHYEIEVKCYLGEDIESRLTHKIKGKFYTLPFEYRIDGNENEIFPVSIDGLNCHEFLLSASIYNHVGSTLSVGDLISEHRSSVDGSGFEKNIAVYGVESCDSEYSGGFCISETSLEAEENLATVFGPDGQLIDYDRSKAWNAVNPGVSCCCSQDTIIEAFNNQCLQNGYKLLASYESCCISYCTGVP